MTPEEIDAVPAGRAMDALVARHVMGYLSTEHERWWIHPDGQHTDIEGLPHFSTDIRAARTVPGSAGILAVPGSADIFDVADFSDFFGDIFEELFKGESKGDEQGANTGVSGLPRQRVAKPLAICQAALKEAFKEK